MEPWLSWASAIAIGGAAYLYYRNARDDKRSSRRKGQAEKPSLAQSRQHHDKQSRRGDLPSAHQNSASTVPSESTSKSSKTSRGRKAARGLSPGLESAALSTSETGSSHEDDTDDRDWAKQLQAAKKGVRLSSQSKAGNVSPVSHNGMNHTPGSTPQTYDVPSNDDVSDMLEPPSKGPSVVPLTGEAASKRSVDRQTTPQPHETKKQRQNRKKNEEKKQILQDQEDDRRIQMENQRRAAREARGEPSKNGLVEATAPTGPAWSKSPVLPNTTSHQVRINSNHTTPQPVQLSDTLADENLNRGSRQSTHESKSMSLQSTGIDDVALPSEEAQIEWINGVNGDVGWNEVTKNKKMKKKSPAAGPTLPESTVKSNGQFASTPTSDLISAGSEVSLSLTTKTPMGNGFQALEAATQVSKGQKAHPEDSDWAVE